jgi:hypothetical protein
MSELRNQLASANLEKSQISTVSEEHGHPPK